MRRLLTVRALGLMLVALLLIAVMVALGWWQFGVYDDHQRADALDTMRRPPVPIDRALGPDQAFRADSVGVPVLVEGRYRAAGQLYVRGLDGAGEPFAVVTPLVTASGSAVLVVRGSSRRPEASAPSGRVHVEGVLEPSQTGGSPLDGQRITDGIDVGSLVSGVRPDLYSGYVVLTASSPAERLTRVQPPLPDASRWAGLRNLIYALQWWVFAGFVAFMWWRIVADADADTIDAETVRSRPSGTVSP